MHNSKIFKVGLKTPKIIETNKSDCKKEDISSDKTDPFENIEPIMPRSMADLMEGSFFGKKSQAVHVS